ncbi:SMI1/KNR4 family protein [Sporosarcina thermotolerans]|uniref:SMI1/KNR4 family protein n=1 Tax=Sporosarcina thermotolerans TaxID=633404 RepID=A0AAW9A829_9BACL|nr:SMI1/KNR4 family protein [Sporosarcina thermotolerans]MDW0117189.1 SMI1/KNR4 family protein [Sporosarcina thermotolerans]WHT47358.1 SMI1/KNR4 family protein [Sporosarcina thermotolerans]
MKVKEFIKQYNERYPNKEFSNERLGRFPLGDRQRRATEEMIITHEEKLGFRFPPSFKEFLLEFSNGIILLGWEPIGGVGPNAPFAEICKVERIIPNIPSNVLILDTNEFVESNRLISLTMYDSRDISNDHWVFICEENAIDYRLGYVAQSALKIVEVVENFEKWLEIFWEGNKDKEDKMTVSTFQILVPDHWDRQRLVAPWE